MPSPNEIVDQKFGAFVGLAAALGIAVGGYDSLREEGRLVRKSSPKNPLEAGSAPR